MSLFDKPALSPEDLLTRLRERGLNIPDESRTRHYLANISYYRLSAYARRFYVPNEAEHRFIANTSFDDVLALYVFDRELRLLLLDAIERIEVALRAQLTNTLAEHHGPHGYLDAGIFDNRYNHGWLTEKLREEAGGPNAEAFVTHYRNKYTDAPAQPPIWMAVELLTFRTVSVLFSQLRRPADTQRIAHHFGWPHAVLRSWFRSLSDLRNLCAHHMRVWNREFGSRPSMPKRPPRDWPRLPEAIPCGSPEHPDQQLDPQRRLYMQLVVIESLMRVVCPESRWAERLVRLLDANPNVSRPHMGFPEGWEDESFWIGSIAAVRGAKT